MIKETDEVNSSIVMQLITNISSRTANRRIIMCREALKKSKNEILFVFEFKKYYGIQ